MDAAGRRRLSRRGSAARAWVVKPRRRGAARAAVGRLLPGAACLLLAMLAAGCTIPRWPVDGPVTSPWGLRLRGWSPQVHRGIDVAVPDGTPVHAMEGGRVAFAGTMSGYGLVVILRHNSHLATVYGHLSELKVRTGEEVHGHQVIALSGHSGDATGPHLHFEILRWGHAADPVPLLGGPPE